MHMLKKLTAVAALVLLAVPALAQSNPNLQFRDVPTAIQWNSYFSAKQDVLGFTPLSQAGGTLTGRLITAAPGASLSGLNLTPGTTPGSPVNGDIWITSSGFFARVNGSTLAIGASSGSVTSVALALPSFITVTGSPITLNGTLTGTLAVQNANKFFSGPTTGADAAPTFRLLVNGDFPSGFVNCGTGLTGGALVGGGTCAIDKATSSNFFAGTSNKVLTADIVYSAETTTTFATSQTFDMSTFINTAVTLTGPSTTQTFTNIVAGKAGTIRFIQDATGGRTTVWNSILKWPAGTPPALSTAANAVDALNYNCISTTYCQASLAKSIQ